MFGGVALRAFFKLSVCLVFPLLCYSFVKMRCIITTDRLPELLPVCISAPSSVSLEVLVLRRLEQYELRSLCC